MSGFWKWPEGAQEAAAEILEASLDGALESEWPDDEEREDVRMSVVGDVMRALAPYVTKLVEAQDHEAYQRGLDAAEDAVRLDYSSFNAIARNVDKLRQAAWQMDPRNPNRLKVKP